MTTLKFYIYFILLLTVSNFNLKAQLSPTDQADFLILQGNYQEALNTLNNYIDLNPTDAELFIKRATVFGLTGQHSKKVQDLEFATYLNPFAYLYVNESLRSQFYEKKQYEYNIGRQSSEFNKSPIQVSYYDRYLIDELNIHNQDSLFSKAIYFLSINDIDKAELVTEQIIESKNTRGILFDLKGVINLKKNNLGEAISLFSKAIEALPKFPLAYHNRAVAYKLKGDFEKAKEDLNTAINLNENISVFYFTLAKLSERLEKPNEAISYYQEALNKNPNYIEARTNYSMLQKSLGNYQKSVEELEEILSRTDNKSKKHFIKGGIHFTYGEYESAITEFDKYLSYFNNDSDAIFNRGLAKILLGSKIEGCSDISYSLELEDNSNRQEIFISFCPSY